MNVATYGSLERPENSRGPVQDKVANSFKCLDLPKATLQASGWGNDDYVLKKRETSSLSSNSPTSRRSSREKQTSCQSSKRNDEHGRGGKQSSTPRRTQRSRNLDSDEIIHSTSTSKKSEPLRSARDMLPSEESDGPEGNMETIGTRLRNAHGDELESNSTTRRRSNNGGSGGGDRKQSSSSELLLRRSSSEHHLEHEPSRRSIAEETPLTRRQMIHRLATARGFPRSGERSAFARKVQSSRGLHYRENALCHSPNPSCDEESGASPSGVGIRDLPAKTSQSSRNLPREEHRSTHSPNPTSHEECNKCPPGVGVGTRASLSVRRYRARANLSFHEESGMSTPSFGTRVSPSHKSRSLRCLHRDEPVSTLELRPADHEEVDKSNLAGGTMPRRPSGLTRTVSTRTARRIRSSSLKASTREWMIVDPNSTSISLSVGKITEGENNGVVASKSRPLQRPLISKSRPSQRSMSRSRSGEQMEESKDDEIMNTSRESRRRSSPCTKPGQTLTKTDKDKSVEGLTSDRFLIRQTSSRRLVNESSKADNSSNRSGLSVGAKDHSRRAPLNPLSSSSPSPQPMGGSDARRRLHESHSSRKTDRALVETSGASSMPRTNKSDEPNSSKPNRRYSTGSALHDAPIALRIQRQEGSRSLLPRSSSVARLLTSRDAKNESSSTLTLRPAVRHSQPLKTSLHQLCAAARGAIGASPSAVNRLAGIDAENEPSGTSTITPAFRSSRPLKTSVHQLCATALGGVGGTSLAVDPLAGNEAKSDVSGASDVTPVLQMSQPLKTSLHQLCTSAFGSIGGAAHKNKTHTDLASVASERIDLDAAKTHPPPPTMEKHVPTSSGSSAAAPHYASSIQIDVSDPGYVDFYFFRAADHSHRRCHRCRARCEQVYSNNSDDTSVATTTTRSFG